MTIGLIVACSVNGVIGVDGKIPWNYPGDFKRFKELTQDSVVIMGRKTWESLPKKPLPNRMNIIVTSEEAMNFDNKWHGKAWAKSSIPDAMRLADFLEPDKDVWFIGGKRIYEECTSYCDIMDFTFVPLMIQVEKAVRIDEMKMVAQEVNKWHCPKGVQPHPYEENLTFKRYLRR